MTLVGAVAALWRYPVSSLAGEQLPEIEIGQGGVLGDRIWGLAEAGTAKTADPDREKRWRATPMMQARLGNQGPEVRAGTESWATLPSPAADQAASALVGFPAAFHPHPESGGEHQDAIARRYRLAPVHLLTTASLAKLARLVEAPAKVDARRFRPNIVVETEPGLAGFVEKAWIGKRLAFGDVVLAVTEPCARCSFTALAQAGLAFEPEILQRIAGHGGGFGVYCAVERGGRLESGEAARLLDA